MSDPIRAIANAVLYEGYILWPYRRSAMKNQQRWTFGGVHPPAHAAAHPDDPCTMQTQCLLEGDPAAKVSVTVRFLQVVRRQLMERSEHGFEPVDALVVDGERLLSWEEAVEREIASGELSVRELARSAAIEPIDIRAGGEEEDLTDLAGDLAGRIERTWEALAGRLEMEAQATKPGVWMVTARIVNDTLCEPGSREVILRQTMCSMHTMLWSSGQFASLTDPPEELADVATRCVNGGTWPVLVGEPGQRDTILSSPIILEDYPRVAPESPGDLFDGGEIDQLLVLNILSLTDEEKAEMRGSDPRAREILERTEGLGPEELMRLHGAVREFGLVRQP